MVRLLAENGALLDSDARGQGILHLAISGPTDILRVLHEYRKVIDNEHLNFVGETPLLTARSDALIENLELLVNAGANINMVNRCPSQSPG